MHRKPLHRLVPAVAALLLTTACGDDGPMDGDVGTCAAGLKIGQLVITELMPDPAGADASGVEWIELYNPGPDAVSLAEVGLEVSKVDGTTAKGHRVRNAELTLDPGAYMTFGRVTDDQRPDYIDYGYGAELTMGNTDGKVRVVCGTLVIDEALYVDLDDGVTRQLKPGAEDVEANDDLTNWCAGSEPFAAEFGTPRAANSMCPLPETACGQCYEDGELRDAMVPGPGQLVINELMPNASSDPASIGEWFELFVADGPVDLNCLQYGGNSSKFAADPSTAEMLQEPACLTVDAGSFVVFGSQKKWPEFDHELGFTLVDSKSDSNPNPGVFVAYDNKILDEAHYAKTNDGVSWSLDPKLATPAGNDDLLAFCEAVDPMVGNELGTPGGENPACPVVCPTDSCFEGDTCRSVVHFAPGQVFLTEVFPDPGVSSDGEWFEFVVAADADLNGLTFGKKDTAPYATVTATECRTVTAGTTLLVAASADPEANGGLPSPDIVDTHISLTNTNSSVAIGVITSDGTPLELDSVAWTGTSDGKSHQVALDKVPTGDPFDTAINDDPAAWCDANVMFGAGDFGTPGADNTSCDGPPPSNATCLDGDTIRDVRFPVAGDLLISEVHPDPTALLASNPASGEPNGEWFELYAAADVDLNGLEIGSPALKYTVPSGDTVACAAVGKGSFNVLARAGTISDPPVVAEDPLDNGGLPTPVVQYDGLSLSNSGGTLAVGVAGVEIDSAPFAKPTAGHARQLGANVGCFLADAPLDVACNDDANLVWCSAKQVYGLGDFGTPGAANEACVAAPAAGECFDSVLTMNRPIKAPVAGDLVITEFLANPSGTETSKEWVEVFAVNPVDLNGLKVLGNGAPTQEEIDAANPACTNATCVPLTAGSYVLLAKKTDPLLNGNLPAVDCVLVPSLSNSNDGVAVAHGSTLLHGITWGSSQPEDLSTMLDPASKDPMFVDTDAPPWCTAADAGTPKQENPPCP